MFSFTHLGLIAAGSALGGVARWLVGMMFVRLLGQTAFPWGTFAINVTGSLFLGWFSTLLAEYWTFREESWFRDEEWRLLVAVGFTGAYTTFSTFEAETYRLFFQGFPWIAIFYLTGSVFLGLVAFRIGMVLAGGH